MEKTSWPGVSSGCVASNVFMHCAAGAGWWEYYSRWIEEDVFSFLSSQEHMLVCFVTYRSL